MLTTESPLSGSTSVPDLLLPRLPRPDTFNPDLFTVLLFQAHAQGRPALTDFHLAQMVQTLAWCHGSDRGHPRLTGSTIDGRHYVTIPHTAWLSTCPDLTRSTLNRVLSICSEDLPDDRRAGGLFITRRSVHGLMHSLDLDLLRRWYHEAHVTESRLTDTLSHHRPSSVRHDHDLCDVLNLTGAGGSMLGLMLRQLAWWQGSDQGHVPRLAARQLSDGYHYVAKTRASWQRVHPALTQWVVHRLLEEARAAGFLRAELALLKNLNIGGLNLRVEYDALRRAHLQTLGRPPADDWLSPAPVIGTAQG